MANAGVTGQRLADRTKAIDPDGRGVSLRQIKEAKADRGERSLRVAALIHAATGGAVPIAALLDGKWLRRLLARALDAPDLERAA